MNSVEVLSNFEYITQRENQQSGDILSGKLVCPLGGARVGVIQLL